MWKRKPKTEFLPWYRARNYKGKLTEVQKRELDAFRSQVAHPAVKLESLPIEVQYYISHLEGEMYEDKQGVIFHAAYLTSLVGAYLIYQLYSGYDPPPVEPTTWRYFSATLLLLVPWIAYRYLWKKHKQRFMPGDDDGPLPTDKALLKEWELLYFRGKTRKEKTAEPS